METKRNQIKTLVGSRFWCINKEDSDYDYMVIQLPTKDDLYNNNWIRGKSYEENKDISYIDARDFLIKLGEGKISYFESLFSLEAICEGNSAEMFYLILKEYRHEIFLSVRTKIIRNTYYELKNRLKEMYDPNSDLEKYRKTVSHILKLIRIFKFCECGGNPFYKEKDSKFIMTDSIKELVEVRNGYVKVELDQIMNRADKILSKYENSYKEEFEKDFKRERPKKVLDKVNKMLKILIEGSY